MSSERLLVLFGDQLFANRYLRRAKADRVFMAESESMCRRYRAHRHKLVLILSGMRSKADALRTSGYTVDYVPFDDSRDRTFVELLDAQLATRTCGTLVHFETESPRFEARLDALCLRRGIEREVLSSPKFITSHSDFARYRSTHKRLFMAEFYKWQRRELRVLLDDDGAPIGGRWSYDEDNRKKLPRGLMPPSMPKPRWTAHTSQLAAIVDQSFPDHPGSAKNFWLPTTEAQAKKWLATFLDERFDLFGDYEDALSQRHSTVFHSVLSPLLNSGLLTPRDVLDRSMSYADEHGVRLNSLEGFIRQVIGWREFIRGVWHTLPEAHWKQNFFGHERRLSDDWYRGSTGIPPLDDAIQRAVATGYNHHIERLMIVGNLMLLCRVAPPTAYQWFMEMYVDSASWVMAPNVFGMALFSEGGAFTTKPYICGSNYIRKMSDYGKGPWCDVVDGLYWSFVEENRPLFSNNPRSKMMLGSLDRMSSKRRTHIFAEAEAFRARVTV